MNYINLLELFLSVFNYGIHLKMVQKHQKGLAFKRTNGCSKFATWGPIAVQFIFVHLVGKGHLAHVES